MFKSMRRKITGLFILLSVLTELTVGIFFIFSTVNYYHKDFVNSVNNVFTDALKDELNSAATGLTVPPHPDDSNNIILEQTVQNNVDSIVKIMNYYTGPLAISASRFYCVLDGKTGAVLYSSNNADATEATPVIESALHGNSTFETTLTKSYMDYAVPLGNNSDLKFILYIKDTLDTQHSVTGSMRNILAQAVFITAVLGLICGLLISRMITVPIQKLNNLTRRIADGESEDKLRMIGDCTGDDEFGKLTASLLYLAHTRNKTSEAVKDEKIKVETILQNMSDGILAFDSSGNLLHINPEAQRLLDRKYVDDISFDRFFKEINAGITLDDLIEGPDDETNTEREVKLKNHYLKFSFATFNLDADGGGIIVVIHDVTKHEKLEQSRRDFVADVSHELRTPLTTIKSYAETLVDTPDADKELRLRFLNVISSEADRMSRIIRDLLTLSELDEKQTLYKQPEPIDIKKMLTGIVDRMEITAKKKNQTITYSCINEIPPISGDRDGLERVFINILTNAMKYTPSGGHIEVFSSKVYKDITIKISDNGIGIPADKLPHIFDRFYRVDKARSRDKGGTGLGLAIAKQTLETSFNGNIKINSEVNKGTDVIITIPTGA